MPQFLKYLITGVTCTGLDYLSYRALLVSSIDINAAKAIGVVLGMLLGYFLNSRWTFQNKPGINTLLKYFCVYGLSVGLNVCINSGVLMASARFIYAIQFAFLCAAAASALFNFISLKFWVF